MVWAVTDRPWEMEKALLTSLVLPLNLQGNKHPFGPILKQVRKAARDRARLLPTMADNGGTRRLGDAEVSRLVE